MKLKPKYDCLCWVCSKHLRAVEKKLNEDEKLWFTNLLNRCIDAEMHADYLEMKRKGKFK